MRRWLLTLLVALLLLAPTVRLQAATPSLLYPFVPAVHKAYKVATEAITNESPHVIRRGDFAFTEDVVLPGGQVVILEVEGVWREVGPMDSIIRAALSSRPVGRA